MELARSYDVIVVGAGSAGCVLAARLSETADRQVLLVEAGPDYPQRHLLPPDIADGTTVAGSHDWGYLSMPGEGGRMVPLPRGRLVGGSSAVNGTFALRGFPDDYDEWADVGNDGWGFAEVLPAFRALENDLDYGEEPWHGHAGPLPIRRYLPQEMSLAARALLESAVAIGHKDVPDHNRPGATGAGALPVNTIGGVRMSTALTHLAAARSRANLTIRSGVLVDRIDIDRGQARGVRLADGELLAADLVILAAGAYGSPAIMLRSGLGPAGELGALGIDVQADLPGVGRNLVDHPLASVALPAPAEPRRTARYQTMVTLASPHSTRPDLHIFAAGPFETDSRAATGGAVLGVGLALVKPDSRGTVRLASADPDAPPRIDPAHLQAPQDRKRMLFALQEARRLVRIAPLSELVTGPELAPAPGIGDHDTKRLTAALAGQVWSYHHPVGTCAMGADPAEGAVVDARGRVHGIRNLMVADASIMPTIPAANTNLPTIMVAERIAAWLTGTAG